MPSILVTGTNRGLGLELTKEFLAKSWKVFACCRKPESAVELLKLKQQYPNELTIFKLNVTNSEDIAAVAEQLKDEVIDVLFNNAGVFEPNNAHLGTLDEKKSLDVLRINTLAPLLLIQALLKHIEQSDLKTIVNMSSTLGSISHSEMGDYYVYRASKAGLNAITASLATDLKNKNITIVAISPGWVKTDMGGPNAELSVEESVHSLIDVIQQLSIKDSGRFLSHRGEEIEW